MDHRGDMVVDHRSSVNKTGQSRLWVSRLRLRCPQVDNFNRVSNLCNDFLNSSFNSNFFNGFFHNRLDNSLFDSLFDSLLYSSSWDRLSYNMNTDRQLTAEDGRVVVRGVHRVVDQRCVVDHRGVHSMVDPRGSVVDDGWAVVDGVMDKGSRMDRGVMDSVNGSMCVVDWHVRPVHAVCCLGMEGGEAGVRPCSGQGQQQQRDGLHDVCRWYAGLCGSDTWFPLPIII
jgi:hypothetical protein